METKFAEWLAENHYRLGNVFRSKDGNKVYIWENEYNAKTSQELYNEFLKDNEYKGI